MQEHGALRARASVLPSSAAVLSGAVGRPLMMGTPLLATFAPPEKRERIVPPSASTQMRRSFRPRKPDSK